MTNLFTPLVFFCFACLRIQCILSSPQTQKPNIVFILTDDQDITLEGFSMMPQTKASIVNKGLTFTNAFVHSPICCISRASILSGRYVHNHHTRNNSISGGCSDDFWQQTIEPTCFAAHISNAGYNTFYAGKYLNEYGYAAAGGTAWIPAGFRNWYGLVGNSVYYNEHISNNGTTLAFGNNYTTDYYTNVIHQQAITFLETQVSQNLDEPFLMVMATPAAHAPFESAPEYNNTAADKTSPHTPNWNNIQINENKHQLMRLVPKMNDLVSNQSDWSWRFRLGCLKSVDDMVQDIYDHIESMGLLNNTYFLFTSDHGFHLGQYGMGYDKRQLYENDIRIPFVMSGPGIPHGQTTDIIALNIDIAPTLVDIVTGSVPEYMDGRSLLPYLNGMEDEVVDQQFLIEYYGEQYNSNTGISMCSGYPGFEAQVCDMWNNSYNCVRSIDGSSGEVNGTIYCRFLCFDWGKNSVECEENSVDAQGEFYNLDTDYFELDNVWSSLNATEVQAYESKIDTFMKCVGQSDCNVLRETTVATNSLSN